MERRALLRLDDVDEFVSFCSDDRFLGTINVVALLLDLPVPCWAHSAMFSWLDR